MLPSQAPLGPKGLEEIAGAANACPTSRGRLETWEGEVVVPELRPCPYCFLQEELEKPEGLVVTFQHQLEKHHHLVEALLVLWGGGRQRGGWSLGVGRAGIPGRN